MADGSNSIPFGRLLWSPSSLALVAAHSSTPLAILVGSLALAIELALPPVILGSCANEPYPTLAPVIRGAVIGGPFAVALFWTAAVMALSGIRFLSSRLELSALTRARFRIALLCPVCVLIPLMVWSVLFAFACIGHPNFGLTAVTKPAWIQSPIIAVFGSCMWWCIGILLACLNAARATEQLKRMTWLDAPHCSACGYNLTANTSGVCPECGRSIKRDRSN